MRTSSWSDSAGALFSWPSWSATLCSLFFFLTSMPVFWWMRSKSSSSSSMCFFLLFFLRPSSPSRLTAEAAPDDLSSSSPYSTSSSSAMKFLSYTNAWLMRVYWFLPLHPPHRSLPRLHPHRHRGCSSRQSDDGGGDAYSSLHHHGSLHRP